MWIVLLLYWRKNVLFKKIWRNVLLALDVETTTFDDFMARTRNKQKIQILLSKMKMERKNIPLILVSFMQIKSISSLKDSIIDISNTGVRTLVDLTKSKNTKDFFRSNMLNFFFWLWIYWVLKNMNDKFR